MALGLPSVSFTEHLDHTSWTVDRAAAGDNEHLASMIGPDDVLVPPAFDLEGFLEAVDRCRVGFPGPRVLSGVELGEPHWHADQVARVLQLGPFDRVLGSLHCLPDGSGRFMEPPGLYGVRSPRDVVHSYLAELVLMVERSDVSSVVVHVDYPLRYWPERAHGAFDLADFEDEVRLAPRAIARSGRVLEFNTVLPMDVMVLRWWHQEGGTAITFGSDAHEPAEVARKFGQAVAVAESAGFIPQRDPLDPWGRQGRG